MILNTHDKKKEKEVVFKRSQNFNLKYLYSSQVFLKLFSKRYYIYSDNWQKELRTKLIENCDDVVQEWLDAKSLKETFWEYWKLCVKCVLRLKIYKGIKNVEKVFVTCSIMGWEILIKGSFERKQSLIQLIVT